MIRGYATTPPISGRSSCAPASPLSRSALSWRSSTCSWRGMREPRPSATASRGMSSRTCSGRPDATRACAHCRRDRAVRPDHTGARRSWGALSGERTRPLSPIFAECYGDITPGDRGGIICKGIRLRAAIWLNPIPADFHRHCSRCFHPEHTLLRVPTDLPSLANTRCAAGNSCVLADRLRRHPDGP